VSPGLEIPPVQPRQRNASTTSVTPRASTNDCSEALPIIPQNTGEWQAFPSFRQSLLGGRSLNRFSNFVTSGAEEWVLNGNESESVPYPGTHQKISSEDSTTEDDENQINRLGPGETDRHFVDVGPAWQTKLPPFRVLVHSPSKRSSTLSGAYTVYSITSLFQPISLDESVSNAQVEHQSILPPPTARITVLRRYSHFVVLHTALSRRLPGIALPPLPEKQYAGRFSNDFVEARRGDLERYINHIVRHPVARYAEVLIFFLGCESDIVRPSP
jgi:sorting nexin-9/18/33